MSERSWRKEFYPTKPNRRMTAIQATKHSLKKWIGILPENLIAHDLDYIPITMMSTSCALCHISTRKGEVDCEVCPLYKYTKKECSDDGSPWGSWCNTGNPRPMIRALTATLDYLRVKKSPRSRHKK